MSLWYPDADGDGYGVDSTGIFSCAQPPGYVAVGGDCDDTNADTHTGAQEINDGLDNQCPGDFGHGWADEVSGLARFVAPEAFCWEPQEGATHYVALRTDAVDDAGNCLTGLVEIPCWLTPENPGPGEIYYYLVRSVYPFLGSWGGGTDERVVTCSTGQEGLSGSAVRAAR